MRVRARNPPYAGYAVRRVFRTMRLIPQLLIVATLTVLSAAPAFAQGLYPTAVGSRWELADSSGATLVRTIASSKVATDGKTVFSIRDKLADGRYRTRWLREE